MARTFSKAERRKRVDHRIVRRELKKLVDAGLMRPEAAERLNRKSRAFA